MNSLPPRVSLATATSTTATATGSIHYGTAGDDVLVGGEGNDLLYGYGGNDVLEGRGGDDTIRAELGDGSGLTRIDGGAGADQIMVAVGAQSTARLLARGGAGIDTYVLMPDESGIKSDLDIRVADFRAGAAGDRIELGWLLPYGYGRNPFDDGLLRLQRDGADTLLQWRADAGGQTYHTVLRLEGVLPAQLGAANFAGGVNPNGGTTGLTLLGTTGMDELPGSLLDDIITGLGSDDMLWGLNGNDRLDGGDGNDRLYGGEGDDVLFGGAGDDLLYELDDENGNNRLDGGVGNDTLQSGSTGTNLLDGGDGNDRLEGGNGNDTLRGGAGNDTLYVSSDANLAPRTVTLSGGAGDDGLILMIAQAGVRIEAAGDAGADTFYIARANAGLRILDFNETEGDRLDLDSLAPYGVAGNPLGASGYLRLVQNGADTELWVDSDGAAGAAATATLAATLVGVDLVRMTRAAIVGGLDPHGSEIGKTIDGTPLEDVLEGTRLDDTMRGFDGDDKLNGLQGNDRLEGGNGADWLWGATGNDTLFGDAGNDYLDGGEGDDVLDGGSGSDTLRGGAGDDRLVGGEGNDLLTDDDGNNVLEGGAGDDTIRAGIGLPQRGSRTTVDGGDGNDRIEAGLGIAAILGGTGNDQIIVTDPTRYFDSLATAQPLRIDAGDGDDQLHFDGAQQALRPVLATGGAGRDSYHFTQIPFLPLLTITDFAAGAGGDVIDVDSFMGVAAEERNPFGAAGRLRLEQRGADTVLQHDLDGAANAESGWTDRVIFKDTLRSTLVAENFIGIDPFGSTVGIALTGADGDDILDGGRFDDVLRGGAGKDILTGGRGDDVLHGDAGNDLLSGDAGDDQLFGGDGDDFLSDSHGANLLDGGDGNDWLTTTNGEGNVLRGGAGNDTLLASGGGNLLDGGDGDDQLVLRTDPGAALSTVNTVHGGAGNDRIELTLASGSDVIADGGAGRDTYVLGGPSQRGVVTILDFQTGEGGDLLDLTGFVERWTHGQANPFGPDTGMRTIQRGADTVIQLPAAGAASGYQDIVVLANLDKSTLGAANIAWGFNPDGSSRGREIVGSDGADDLFGGWLDDVIVGGGGNDILMGLLGNDHLIGGDGDDILNGDLTLEIPSGLAARPTGHDLLEGGAGNDILISGWGNDVLRGGDGDDLLQLMNDDPNGGAVVEMHGDAGNDRFEVRGSPGQPMRVTLSGGEGRDTYSMAWQPALGAVTILDFEAGAGGDLLQVGMLVNWDGGNPFAAGRMRLFQQGGDTLLQIDADGPRGAAGFETVVVLAGVDASKLVAQNIVEGYQPVVASTAPPAPPTSGPGPGPGTSVPVPPTTPPVPVPPIDRTGGAQADRLVGGSGDDRLDGGAGNDVLIGGAGNDILVGGSGTDSAHYGGARSDYTVTIGADGMRVLDRRGSAGDGSDTLYGVERLHFADGALALDIDGVAGQAYRIYRAAFDRSPDLGGVGFWISRLDAGITLDQIAGGFVASSEFATLYGSAPSNAEIVLRLYQNILDREPEAGGYAFWLDVLDSGRAGLNTVLASFSESAENRDAVVELIANGITFTPYGG